MKEISIKDIEGIRIGQAENVVAGTGCTVVICDKGMRAGADIRGGGPATRESELLKSETSAQYIHAVTLSGGSAFGLNAADGVMKYLEERNIGYDVGITKVPLVCQASLFDLTVGDMRVRPDKDMGYTACMNSENGGNYQDGNHGAGTGATVGKLKGMDFCMKSGIGSYCISLGELKIGAIVAVNALGDVYDWKNGRKVAGMLNSEKNAFSSVTDEMYKSFEMVENKFTGNTTLGIIITNGKFDKPRLNKISGMAHNGYARSIRPVHTSADGDFIFSLSVGEIEADLDVVGTLAADVVSEAILRAVQSADSAYGFTALKDFILA